MCPEKRTGSQNESDNCDVKASASKKQYVERSLVIDRRPAAQYPGGQNQVDVAVSVTPSEELLTE